MLYEKLKVKKYLSFLFEFFSFFVFLSLFSMFFLCFLLFQVILGGLQLFEKIYFTFLRRALCSTWKKLIFKWQSLIKKLLLKFLGSPTQSVHHETLLNFVADFSWYVSRKIAWIFFWLRINGKTIKNKWFLR